MGCRLRCEDISQFEKNSQTLRVQVGESGFSTAAVKARGRGIVSVRRRVAECRYPSQDTSRDTGERRKNQKKSWDRAAQPYGPHVRKQQRQQRNRGQRPPVIRFEIHSHIRAKRYLSDLSA